MSNIIKPELPGGFNDYLPEEQKIREKMVEVVRQTFERFGFLPMETPGVEKMKILTGGDPAFEKQIFKIERGEEKEELGLRFDLTVPLARVAAAYPDKLNRPLKVYRIGKVWRGEKPQAGRYREFLQCDADIVGAPGPMADAEIVSLIYETLSALGLSNFKIYINSRNLLNGLAELADFGSEKNKAVFRVLDKLDKIGFEEVKRELKDIGLNDSQIKKISEFFGYRLKSKKDAFDDLAAQLGRVKIAQKALKEEIEPLLNYTGKLDVPDEVLGIDPVLARGLGYYTGLIYEAVLTDLPKVGTVFSGGRYDKLIARFGADMPATGASLGFDRLFAVMKELNIVVCSKPIPQVLVLNFDYSAKDACLNITQELRREGISTDIYLGQEGNLKGQLAYAVKRQIPLVVIIGGEEVNKQTIRLKDMRARTEEEVSQKEVVGRIKKVLAS